MGSDDCARIAIVHPRLDRRGGAENLTLWLARGLRGRGHEIAVATTRFAPELWDPGDWEGVPLVVLAPRGSDRFRARAARKRAIGRRLGRALPDCEVIVAHNSPAPLWATTAARRRPGVRVVWLCEEPRAQYHWRESSPTLAAAARDLDARPWLREALAPMLERDRERARSRGHAIDRRLDLESVPRVDRVVANSAFTAKNAERVFGIRAAPCLLGLPPPAPVAKTPREPYVAWVTSSNPGKNAAGFLEAIRIAVREHGASDLRVEAVGLADDAWARRVAELGLEGVVRRNGWLAEAALNELVAGARLLAYPAIDEPFGLVCLHAMAHARPVLASRIGGPSEIVVDGVTGLHVDPLDPQDMARRLHELWSSPSRCEALGAAGRERYDADFTFERFLDRFEALLRAG